ncbi:hypothetical protein [Accumulibacter sp.]|uniref:hypothetical protein n=1 Tax=Accumulibacter sp. TaxID=2053492 RepID=UPI0026189609|nr:hypothetical protein [Accumulibacter sp.]
MSNVLNSLLSRSGLLKTVAAGVFLAASVAANAAVDAPAAPSRLGDSAIQAQDFDTVAGLAASPLSVAEAESVDGARFKWRLPKRWPHPKPRRCAPGGPLPSICI